MVAPADDKLAVGAGTMLVMIKDQEIGLRLSTHGTAW